MGKQWGPILGGSKIIADGDCSHEIKRCLLLGRKAMANLDSIKNRDITLPTKVCLVNAISFPVVRYGCDNRTIKKSEPKSWCFWIVVLEKTLESPLDCKEIKTVHSKGSQSWIFIGRTDAVAETPILWPPWCEALTHWKRPWYWERLKAGGEGTTEDEMAGWHHQLNGHEFEQAPGVGDGQGSLACCIPWGHKYLHTTEWLKWTELMTKIDCIILCHFATCG